MAKTEKKLIANNKKAYHDYFLEERFEAGIELHGTEVKSMRMGKCSIKEAFVRIENGEVIVYGMHVSPYEKGNIFNKDPLRPKKLLMHKSEIRKLTGKLAEQGYTLVPVEVYLKGSLVKVEIALAKGKKLYDKRQDIAKKDMRREAERDIHLDGDGFRQIAAINTAGHKATPPQLIRFCLFVPFFYFDNVHCDPPCNMVYIKRKTSFFAGGKKQKPFFSDGSFYLVFSSRTPADCRICKKEGPSIQRPAAWYQKPFFNRRFFFRFSSL